MKGKQFCGFRVALLVAVVSAVPFLNASVFLFVIDAIWSMLSWLDSSSQSFERNAQMQSEHYRPMTSEGTHYNLNIIKGSIPKEANGVFVNIGPNPKYWNYDQGSTEYNLGKHHWFEGDGMIHAMNIFSKNQSAHYSNQWVLTRKILEETKYKRKLYTFIMGDFFDNGWLGMAKLLLSQFVQWFPLSPFKIESALTYGPSNTAVVFWDKQLYALSENSLPFEISIDKDSSAITQFGFDSVSPAWKVPFTAHPKIDPITNELITFGYSGHMNHHIFVGIVDPKTHDTSMVSVPISHDQFMHDIMITDEYIIVVDTNLWIGGDVFLKHGKFSNFETDRASRFGLIKRDQLKHDIGSINNQVLTLKNVENIKNLSSIEWIDIKTCMIFHMATAYKSQDTLTLIGARMENPKIQVFQDPSTVTHDGSMEQDGVPYLYKWTIRLDDHTLMSEGRIESMKDFPCDFPILHPKRQGSGQRPDAIFVSHFEFVDLVPFQTKIGKLNVKEDTFETISFGANRVGCTEPAFMASDPTGTRDDTRDGDGYISSVIYNYDTKQTTLEIFNATTMNSEPVTVIELPNRVPAGFHSLFVDRSQFDKRKRPHYSNVAKRRVKALR